MVFGEYWWVTYLLFLAIPLARILPRIVSKYGREDLGPDGRNDGYRQSDAWRGAEPKRSRENEYDGDMRREYGGNGGPPEGAGAASAGGQTDEMIVLGVLHRGAKTFESIQKMTGMGDAALDKTLATLEDKQMIRVVHRKGLLGVSVEIHPTDKGFGMRYGR